MSLRATPEQRLKWAARVLLQSAGLSVRERPTALRHAERHRGQLRALGLDLPRLVPYGCRRPGIVAGARGSMIEATVMGPAEGMPSTAGAYTGQRRWMDTGFEQLLWCSRIAQQP